ncbi:MAG TPA: diguanylate cyclase [Burkholderiales bacterium]|nr:diguanylate cyclase [Burkholderiales bacterium]
MAEEPQRAGERGLLRLVGKRPIAVALAVSTVGLLALGGVVFQLLETADRNDAVVARTFTAISRLANLHQTLLEAESIGRAYLFTAEVPYRHGFTTKVAEVEERLREVKEIASDGGHEKALATRLEQQIARRYAYLEDILNIRATRGPEAARAASIGTGAMEMQAISSTLANLKQVQSEFLRARMAERQQSAQAFRLGFAVLLLCGTGILGLLFWEMNRLWLHRVKAQAHAQHLAHHDALTGLPNRRLLEDRLKLQIARAERDGRRFAVLCLDLDGFKAVNDRYGHGAGDEILKQVASRLVAALRAEDTIARLGGDEFALILPRAYTLEQAQLVAYKVIRAISDPYTVADNVAGIGTSVGISEFPSHGSDAETLLERADLALYAAKRAGKGRYVVWDGADFAGRTAG